MSPLDANDFAYHVSGPIEGFLEAFTRAPIFYPADDCKHEWGPRTEYAIGKLNKDGSLKRVDTRSRQVCTKCHGTDDRLEAISHAGGQLEL